MELNILKCHGTGNDFILIDEISNNYNISETDRKIITLELCKRTGILGADGILFVQNSSVCDAKMRIFNADASEAEMCGNGLRCVGRYVMELLNKDAVSIETMKAKYDVKNSKDIYNGVRTVEIEINTVDFNTHRLPMNYSSDTLIFKKLLGLSDSLEFTAVSITNPHIVTFVNEFNEADIIKIGYTANNSKDLFMNGVNVNFVKTLGKGNIYVKTYERGVGVTKSCGTGMTASSIVTCLKDQTLFGTEINIYNDGGMIKCIVQKDCHENYKIRFIGNATYVFKSLIKIELLLKNEVTQFMSETFDEETTKYSEFLSYCSSQIAE